MNCFLEFLGKYGLLIQFARVVLTLIVLFFIFYAFRIAKKTLDLQERQRDYYFSPLIFEFVFYDFLDPKNKNISIKFENRSPIPSRESSISLGFKHSKISRDSTWLDAFVSKEEIPVNQSDIKTITYYSLFPSKKVNKSFGRNPILVLDFSDLKGYDYHLEMPFRSKKGYYNVAYSSGRKSKKASSFLKYDEEIEGTYSLIEL